MRKSEIIAIIIILISVILSIIFYPQVPPQVASHWNAQGQVDDYMPRFWGLFLVPILSIIFLLLFIFLPRLDPLKKNLESFRKHFDVFVVLILLFFLYIHILTIIYNLGYSFNLIQVLAPAFTILFFYLGILMSHSKRNWFIGIRTPWTLSSDVVWNKTHKLGAILFKISAVLCLFSLIFPSLAIWFILVPIILFALVTITYSYIIYKKK